MKYRLARKKLKTNVEIQLWLKSMLNWIDNVYVNSIVNLKDGSISLIAAKMMTYDLRKLIEISKKLNINTKQTIHFWEEYYKKKRIL